MILATGSLPDENARQRWLPSAPQLPGLENGNVWSPEEVLRREARLGDTVIVLDEGGNWRGVGTAWALAEQGKRWFWSRPTPLSAKRLRALRPMVRRAGGWHGRAHG
ncbi:hypothetical protein ACFSHQ_02320 [Gemmobacter lanyuensis]